MKITISILAGLTVAFAALAGFLAYQLDKMDKENQQLHQNVLMAATSVDTLLLGQRLPNAYIDGLNKAVEFSKARIGR